MKVTALLLVLFPFMAFSQNRIYVQASATGANNGTSWANAFTELTAALQMADSGDTVWVAQGTYYPTATNDRNMYFSPPSGVKLYGGFQGTETAITQRNWTSFPVLLSGDIGTIGDSTDNTYTVMYMDHPDSTTVLDGFTICNGTALFTGAGNNTAVKKSGGGLYIMAENGAAYPTINHCIFKNNSALRYGGAICINGGNTGSVAPVIINCSFENNYSQYGAGIYKNGGSKTSTTGRIDSCVFSNNYAITWGGGIYADDAETTDSLTISHCTFLQNRSGLGAGIFIGKGRSSGTIAKIYQCLFDQNTGTGVGGIITVYNNTLNIQKIEIDQCRFTHNQSGGMIYISSPVTAGTVISVNNSVIDHNMGITAAQQSLFIKIGCPDYPTLRIRNTTFTSNLFFGIINQELFPFSTEIDHVQFLDNSFSILRLSEDCIVQMTNTIIYNQFSPVINLYTEGEIFSLSGANMEIANSVILASNSQLLSIFSPAVSSVNFTNTIISTKSLIHLQTNAAAPVISFNYSLLDSFTFCSQYPTVTCGAGNLFGLDPLFRDTAGFDFHLLPCSPLINAGTNNIIKPGSKDLDGAPRIQGGKVDIGPYESGIMALTSNPSVSGSCAGSPSGAVQFDLSNVCLPTTYAWAGPGNTTGQQITQLAPGVYQITITDQKNEQITTSFSIPTVLPATVMFTTTPVICGTTTGGSIIPVAGSGGPFQFNWSNGQTDSILTNLTLGIFTVTITGTNGCTATATTTIEPTDELQIDIYKNNISCFGTSDGSVDIQPVNGAAPYQWLWYNGTEQPGISGLAPGNYTGTLTDALGCSTNWIIPITTPDPLAFTTSVTPASGLSQPDGSIDLLPTGGTGNITANWSSGATGWQVTGLLPGIYTVTVTDENQCSTSNTVEVTWSVGTTALEKVNFQITPNPFTNWLHIIPSYTAIPYQFTLTAAHGQVITSQIKSGVDQWTLETGNLLPGVYFWQITTNDVHLSGVLLK